MVQVTPFLWFDNQAKEAAAFYCEIFNGKILDVSYYNEAGPGPAGSVMVVRFDLGGQEVLALNGGPTYQLTEAFSFTITCDSQEEVDYFWGRLTEGGEEVVCGWLKDKFGLSWQVVPRRLPELLGHPDPQVRERAMRAMFGMKKLDLAELEAAAMA